MTALPSRVTLVDVGPRDGLQNEKTPVSTEDKARLIEELIGLGAKRIEAVSFVNPKAVPQMADADAVMAAVPRTDAVSYIGLVLNTRGALRAVDAGVDEYGAAVLGEPTIVLRCTIGDVVDRRRFRSRQPSSAGSARRRADRPRAARRSDPGVGDKPRDQR